MFWIVMQHILLLQYSFVPPLGWCFFRGGLDLIVWITFENGSHIGEDFRTLQRGKFLCLHKAQHPKIHHPPWLHNCHKGHCCQVEWKVAWRRVISLEKNELCKAPSFSLELCPWRWLKRPKHVWGIKLSTVLIRDCVLRWLYYSIWKKTCLPKLFDNFSVVPVLRYVSSFPSGLSETHRIGLRSNYYH